MIVPAIVISIISIIVWGLISIPTAGYSNYVSQQITTTFITLYGIRMALELKGDRRRTDLGILILKSVLYGGFIFALISALIWLVSLVTAVYAAWQLGDHLSLLTIKDATRDAVFAFTFLWLGSKIAVSIVVLAIVNAVMAVPLANAARTSGQGVSDNGFFFGIGRRFIPLFLIFFLSFFPQLYFQFFGFVYAIAPLFFSIFSFVFFQSIPEFDPEVILKGLAASAGVPWLSSWTWSAAALALLSLDGDEPARKEPEPSPEPVSSSDIRALRKSRE